MTAQAETRFRCDRCEIEVNIPIENRPVSERTPAGWLAMTIIERPTIHLCPECAIGFTNFMHRT